jgi:gliding motility-associated-like protein
VQSIGITSFKAAIYKRWGQAVYEWSGADNSWDGNANGRKSPEGVYYYIITAEDFEGNEILKQGDITLKR